MKNLKQYKLLSLMVILAYVLSACSGVPAGAGGESNQNDTDQQVTFTGVVDSIGAGEWTVSGQTVSVTGTTSVDANITVGASVTVEAVIDQNGVLTAVNIESSGDDDGNTNDDNANDDNANDDDANTNDDNSNDNGNSNDDSSGDEQEVIGVVEDIAGDSITISGQEYLIDEFTEFKDEIMVGDQVKAQVIANDDGTFTVLEIEKFDGSDDNSNDNDNSNDDNSNDDNGNDDDSNDDNGNDDDSNDDNSNDDNSNDDNSNG